jgi:hypothetical protein
MQVMWTAVIIMTAIFNLIKSSVRISEKELVYVDMLVVFIKKSKKIKNRKEKKSLFLKKINKETRYP